MKGFRLPEWMKNVLIIGLSCSALYLFTLSPLYQNSPLKDWTVLFLDHTQKTDGAAVSLASALQPARIAVRNETGCYGVQYDTSAVDDAYAQVGSLLENALSGADTAQTVSEAQWQQALTKYGVYFDFSGSIPLSVLASGQPVSETALSASARKFLLALEDDRVLLYYQETASGLFYSCLTSLSGADHLLPIVNSFTPNGAFFAFEDPLYEQCDPNMLLTASVPQPMEYSRSIPFHSEEGDSLNSTLTALSFSGPSVNSYQIGADTIYRSNEDTLQLSDGGTLTYHGGGTRYPVAAEGDALTLKEAIETTRQLTLPTLESFCGSARLFLLSAVQEGRVITVTYGYCLDGAIVWLDDTGWAAQFQFSNGLLTDYTLKFRSYTATGATTLLLPPLQAAAAMTALGAEHSELLLLYQDSGSENGTIAAGWVAG